MKFQEIGWERKVKGRKDNEEIMRLRAVIMLDKKV